MGPVALVHERFLGAVVFGQPPPCRLAAYVIDVGGLLYEPSALLDSLYHVDSRRKNAGKVLFVCHALCLASFEIEQTEINE